MISDSRVQEQAPHEMEPALIHKMAHILDLTCPYRAATLVGLVAEQLFVKAPPRVSLVLGNTGGGCVGGGIGGGCGGSSCGGGVGCACSVCLLVLLFLLWAAN